MNKKINKNGKLDLNKVSGGIAEARHYQDANGLAAAKNYKDEKLSVDLYGFSLRVGQDGVINSEDVAQLKKAGYYLRNNQLVIEPVGINKTLNTQLQNY